MISASPNPFPTPVYVPSANVTSGVSTSTFASAFSIAEFTPAILADNVTPDTVSTVPFASSTAASMASKSVACCSGLTGCCSAVSIATSLITPSTTVNDTVISASPNPFPTPSKVPSVNVTVVDSFPPVDAVSSGLLPTRAFPQNTIPTAKTSAIIVAIIVF